MARQTYYVTREQRHPLYRTRMLQAGPLELDAGAARLYRRLGVELSDEAPKRAAAKAEAPTAPRPADGQGSFSDEREEAPRAAKPKAAPKRKATRRKKS